MKPLDERKVAQKWFLGATKRVWHIENYLEDIPSSYTLWNTSHKPVKIRFDDKVALDKLDLGEDHQKDIKRYAKRIKKGETTLPAILVRLKPDGKRIVRDGNRRCVAIMGLDEETRKKVIIPADVLDEREKPY